MYLNYSSGTVIAPPSIFITRRSKRLLRGRYALAAVSLHVHPFGHVGCKQFPSLPAIQLRHQSYFHRGRSCRSRPSLASPLAWKQLTTFSTSLNTSCLLTPPCFTSQFSLPGQSLPKPKTTLPLKRSAKVVSHAPRQRLMLCSGMQLNRFTTQVRQDAQPETPRPAKAAGAPRG